MGTTTYKKIKKLGFNLAPSQLKIVDIPNDNYKTLGELLSKKLKKKDNGTEIGSINYISQSNHYFIRARALQSDSYLPYWTNETFVPIRPQVFVNYNLKKGDILISKDSNIGEIVILDKDYSNYMFSGAIYKLPIKDYKYYILAFLKHDFFRNQLDLMVPKGSTIRHAKTKFLDCKIPFPSESNSNEIIELVESLLKSIIDKEIEIGNKHAQIKFLIQNELQNNQKKNIFSHEHPSLKEIQDFNRIDAGIYCEDYKKLIFPVINYRNGYSTLDKQGLKLIPGPSLEIKLLGTRIDSDEYKEGFYRLITPKQISNYGVPTYYRYIGTPREISKIEYGDILFGESGTGRTMVYLDKNVNTINNAHAHILRPIPDECDLNKAITIRSILQYYKEIGITDYLTVGGSGGHLSPSYFDRVLIPNLPNSIKIEISKLYYNPELKLKNIKTNADFIKEHEKNNVISGIVNLDQQIKSLQLKLNTILNKIVNKENIEIDYNV